MYLKSDVVYQFNGVQKISVQSQNNSVVWAMKKSSESIVFTDNEKKYTFDIVKKSRYLCVN